MENEQHAASNNSKNWYDKSYKLLLLIPGIFLIFCIGYLYHFNSQNGDFIYKDVSITGGTTITVFAQADVHEVEQVMRQKFSDASVRSISDFSTGDQLGFFIETASEAEEVKSALENYLGYELTTENSSIEFTGAALSSSFYQQLRFAVVVSFVLMAVVVFLIFRTPVRSLSVIIAAVADIIMTVVVVDILGIRMSAAGVVALLMLIGYSVDADILLTTRAIREKEGTINQRIYGAFKTGITMTLTAIAAAAVALAFTHSFSPVLSQMFTIILIGLGFDILNCWITNASILKWYAEVKKI